MKSNILVLAAFAGSAFAGVVTNVESRGPAGDLDLVGREPLDVDIVVREPLEIDVDVREPHDAEIDVRAPLPPPDGGCPTRRQAVPWLRRGDWPFNTTRFVGLIFRTRLFNTRVVYFLTDNRTKDFFYTTSRNERNSSIRNFGYQDRGILGFIFVNRRCGGSPLYRMYNPVRKHHFYTTSQLERSKAKLNGWNDEGVMGFIFSP